MDKTYIAWDDGRIGYIDSICTCNECKKRKQSELFIKNLNGEYLDCIKANYTSGMIYVGENLHDGIQSIVFEYKNQIEKLNLEKEFLQSIINLYSKELAEENK